VASCQCQQELDRNTTMGKSGEAWGEVIPAMHGTSWTEDREKRFDLSRP
jgi:hypothetical protein